MTQDEAASEMRILVQLLKPADSTISAEKLERLQTVLDENNISIEMIMGYLAPSCDDILEICKWKGKEQVCSQLFELVKTSEGFCCSFNFHKEMGSRSLR